MNGFPQLSSLNATPFAPLAVVGSPQSVSLQLHGGVVVFLLQLILLSIQALPHHAEFGGGTKNLWILVYFHCRWCVFLHLSLLQRENPLLFMKLELMINVFSLVNLPTSIMMTLPPIATTLLPHDLLLLPRLEAGHDIPTHVSLALNG
jgi:hypothetical protein